jgi:hypothetical protein
MTKITMNGKKPVFEFTCSACGAHNALFTQIITTTEVKKHV